MKLPAQKTLLIAAVTIVLGGAGVSMVIGGSASARTHEILPVYGQVPAFVLRDQDGQPISSDDLKGRLWLADFIFSRCAGQCPMMSAQMARLASALRSDESVNPALKGGVKLVSFTVDPRWDTSEVLASYAKRYGASSHQWRFVTGDQDTLARLCKEGFRLAVSEEGTPAEPVTHSLRIVLVDRAGNIRGYYDGTEDAAMKRLHDDLRKLLKAS
ncbi:MAG: SCO family protein [Candidatus Omnitrophica bacterium]|nr:SCO family protein [Candidatus Omnitrophota bacterium]